MEILRGFRIFTFDVNGKVCTATVWFCAAGIEDIPPFLYKCHRDDDVFLACAVKLKPITNIVRQLPHFTLSADVEAERFAYNIFKAIDEHSKKLGNGEEIS